MSIRNVQITISILFILAYFALIGSVLAIEVSGKPIGESANSLMGELKILIGVLTAAVAQVLNFWFNTLKEHGDKNAKEA